MKNTRHSLKEMPFNYKINVRRKPKMVQVLDEKLLFICVRDQTVAPQPLSRIDGC